MVQHYTSLVGVNLHNTWLTIGSFDGVHLGHQQLIHELNLQAHQSGAKSVVLTFYPHPAVVLRGKKTHLYLTTPSEKLIQINELQPDVVITHPFTSLISKSTAREFIEYLMEHLGFRQLWTGKDFALGRGREGNVTYLNQLGIELNYKIRVVEPVLSSGRKISSSQIRSLLKEGNIEEANKLLGRPYQVTGIVIHGDGRGKSIGIPTANLEIGSEKIIPGVGVYACRVKLGDKNYIAAVNIGTHPTFESKMPRVNIEAHILDYSGDLYTYPISLLFINRIRGEQRFNRVEELISQIHRDIQNTRELLAS